MGLFKQIRLFSVVIVALYSTEAVSGVDGVIRTGSTGKAGEAPPPWVMPSAQAPQELRPAPVRAFRPEDAVVAPAAAAPEAAATGDRFAQAAFRVDQEERALRARRQELEQGHQVSQRAVSANPRARTETNPLLRDPQTQAPLTHGQVLAVYPTLSRRYEEAIREAEETEARARYNALGNWQTAMQLGQQVEQLTKNIRNLDSNVESQPDSVGAGLNRDSIAQGFGVDNLRAKTKNAQDNASGDANGTNNAGLESGAGSASADSENGGSKTAAGTAGKGAATNFSSNSSGITGDQDLAKLLESAGKDPLVPDSFLKDIESRLAKVREEKDALALVQKLGKEHGIDALTNMKSLDELSNLAAATEERAPGAGDTASEGEGATNTAARTAAASMTDDQAEMVQALQGMVGDAMDNLQGKTKAPGSSEIFSESDKERATRSPTGLGPALEGQGIGGSENSLFPRVSETLRRYHKRGEIRSIQTT